jgi:hypothetical protein
MFDVSNFILTISLCCHFKVIINCCRLIILRLFIKKKNSTYCILIMDGHPTSAIGSNSDSSTHSDNVSTQNPSSALPPKPKKSKQTSMLWEHFTKVEGG